MDQPTASPAITFDSLGIAPQILELLHKRGITVPTPIQHQSIPTALDGKDVVGIAQTGTGKTFAFGLPMLQRLINGPGRGLVVVPTRELALQIEEALQPFARPLNVKMAVLIGGEPIRKQIMAIRNNPRIVVATPGRLNDHLQQRTITLREVSILILDEADQMLDMGFKPQIDKILAHVPKERQTMLFSATMAVEILQLAEKNMQLPMRIEVAPAGTTVAAIQQEIFLIHREEKMPLLEALLREYKGSVLVFSRTKHGAKNLTRRLVMGKYAAAEIHANRTLAQRREALDGFKKGKYRILVATDIAARGIDVQGIELVVNYDLPDDPSDYVHRIGRTARAGRDGRAVSFATGDQRAKIRLIEKMIRVTLPPGKVAGFESMEPALLAASDQKVGSTPRRGGGRGRSGGRTGSRTGSRRHFGSR